MLTIHNRPRTELTSDQAAALLRHPRPIAPNVPLNDLSVRVAITHIRTAGVAAVFLAGKLACVGSTGSAEPTTPADQADVEQDIQNSEIDVDNLLPDACQNCMDSSMSEQDAEAVETPDAFEERRPDSESTSDSNSPADFAHDSDDTAPDAAAESLPPIARWGAHRSNDVYDSNTAGLVTATTLRRWLADWSSHRPVETTGDLIILQWPTTTARPRYIASRDGVRVYDAEEFGSLLQMRSDGLVAELTAPARGLRLDIALRAFRIDPDRDLVLLIPAPDSSQTLHEAASAWLVLRYWGVSHENLSLLDGNLASLPDTEFINEPLTPPVDGAVRVADTEHPNFHLLAGVLDVRNAISNGAPIVDTRPIEEFDAREFSAAPLDMSCLRGRPHCTAVRAGSILGARSLPAASLYRGVSEGFLPLDQLDERWAELGYGSDQVPILFDSDGQHSTVTAFVALAVLGRPVRWYSGSFVQWSALQASHPDAALHRLPVTSPWRTESGTTPQSDQSVWATSDTAVRPLVLNPSVASTDRILLEDRAYREAPPALPAPGGGGNDCLP